MRWMIRFQQDDNRFHLANSLEYIGTPDDMDCLQPNPFCITLDEIEEISIQLNTDALGMGGHTIAHIVTMKSHTAVRLKG